MDPFGVICVVFCYLFIFYAYYVIVGVLIIPLMNDAWGIMHGAFFTIAVVLCVVSHLKASLSNPGYVSLSKVNLDFSDLHTQGDENRLRDGLTVCVKCEIYRPVDSHHCRICKRCIRKRHHHCQWINNCVGELNQKYFMQFVIYIAFMAIYSICFVMFSLINYPDDSFNASSTHPSKRIYHSVFLIVECIVFGMFAFAILCEQVNSIIADDPTSQIVKTNEAMSHHLPSKPSLTYSSSAAAASSSSSNQHHTSSPMTRLNTKKNLYLLRRVFRVDNPLLWLLPFEFSSMTYQKQSSQDNVI